MYRFSKDVYVLKTSLGGYSADWNHSATAESEALRSLCRLARDKTGCDLFADTIKPGDRVVIKPNLVRDWHPEGDDLYAVITHPAVIRAVVDEVYRALKGEGQIIIADAPMADTDFAHLLAVTELQRIVDYYWREHRFEIGLRDVRKYRYRYQPAPGGYGYEVRSSLPGDIAGYCQVDMGRESSYCGLSGLHLLEGTDVARRREAINGHGETTNRYLVSRTMLEADVLVSVPKLKTHYKVGITVNCKGMVGINGDKNLLPHFRWGSTAQGGDQYPAGQQTWIAQQRMRLGRLVGDTLLASQTQVAHALLRVVQYTSGGFAKALRFRPIDPMNGNWPGNDTCWRMAADLIRVAVFADKDGQLQATPQRRFLSIVDGIVGGQGDGPLQPRPKACGVLAAGLHPIAVDWVCAQLMGFDPQKIRYLAELSDGTAAMLQPGYGKVPRDEVQVFSNNPRWDNVNDWPVDDSLQFEPPRHWVGHIEARSVKNSARTFTMGMASSVAS